MIQTFIHTKAVNSASWDVAHLYEHMFIHSFFSLLEKNKINIGTACDITGETFENYIIVRATFYDGDAANLYEAFILQGIVDRTLMSNCFKQCESEDQSIFSDTDEQKLNVQIDSLDQTTWQAGEPSDQQQNNNESNLFQTPWHAKKDSKSFQKIGIASCIQNFTVEEGALFLRCSSIINNLIARDFMIKYGCFVADQREIAGTDTSMGKPMEIVIEKNVQPDELKNHAENVTQDLMNQTDIALIIDHLNEFSAHPIFKNHINEYFNATGYLLDDQKLRDIATSARIKSMLDKCYIIAQVI